MASLLPAQAHGSQACSSERLGDHKPGLREKDCSPPQWAEAFLLTVPKWAVCSMARPGSPTALTGLGACPFGNRAAGSVNWAGRKVLAELLS